MRSPDPPVGGRRQSRFEKVADRFIGGRRASRIELLNRLQGGATLRGRVIHGVKIVVGKKREENRDYGGRDGGRLLAYGQPRILSGLAFRLQNLPHTLP